MTAIVSVYDRVWILRMLASPSRFWTGMARCKKVTLKSFPDVIVTVSVCDRV